LAIVVAVGGFFYARTYDEFESCQTKVTKTSGTPEKVERETSCEPVGVETMVPALLLVLALMWPDLAAVELFGLGRVTRRLNEQDARQNQLEVAQQRLENRISIGIDNSPTFNNFASDPFTALLAERKVAEAQRLLAERNADGQEPPTSTVGFAQLEAAVEPLKPWLNVARRLNDPMFAAAVAAGAAAGSPSDDPRLLQPDVELLRRVQRPGHPFDVAAVQQWAAENSLQVDAVRDTLRAGTAANPESIRVATKFAGQLLSDLQRRGLVANE
jgi:hypothetical protein